MTDTTEPAKEPPKAEFLRRRLRLELTSARHDAGMTQKAIADELAWSVSKVVRMEKGEASVAPSDVRALLSLFRVEEPRIQEVVELAREAKDTEDWSDYDGLLTPSYRELIGQEGSATEILKYEPWAGAGLLQLPA